MSPAPGYLAPWRERTPSVFVGVFGTTQAWITPRTAELWNCWIDGVITLASHENAFWLETGITNNCWDGA